MLLCSGALTDVTANTDASGELAITSVDASNYPEVRIEVANTRGKATGQVWGFARDQVSCRIGGQSAAVSGLSAKSAGGDTLSLAVVLDTSGSIGMPQRARYGPLVEDIVGRLRSDDTVGVFVMSRRDPELTPLTQVDLFPLADLSAIPTEGTTYLYDAVCAAAEGLAASTSGQRALIVITDGRDRRSEHTLQDAVNAINDAQIKVIVGQIGDGDLEVLGALASAGTLTGGESSAELVRALVALVGPLPTTWDVTVTGDASVARGVPQLVLGVTGDGYDVQMARAILVGGAAESTFQDRRGPIPWPLVGVLGLGAIAIVLVFVWILRGRGARY